MPEEYARNLDEEIERDNLDRAISASGKTGTAMKYGGTGTQAAGKVGRVGFKGLTYTGKGISKGADALNKTKYGAIAGVPLKGAGKAVEYTGKAGEKASKAIDKAGRNIRQSGVKARNFSNDLKKARGAGLVGEAKQMTDTAKKIAKAATPIGAFALARQIDYFRDWLMLVPLTFAILKDILDFAGFSLPGINEVMNFCFGILTTFVLILIGSNRGTQKVVRRWLTLLGGVLSEELFGLNLLPIETITVVVIYMMLLAERKQAAKT